MPWLTPSIIATAAGTALLSFVYYYLYFLDRKKYLAVWAVSWSVYFVRFVFMFGMIRAPQNEILLIGNQLTSLFSGIILLWGTYQFINKKFPNAWLFWSALGVIWIILSILLKFGFFLMSIPTFTFLAIVYVWTGLTFAKSKVSTGLAKTATGVAFVVWGVHKINYPFLRPVVWFAPWGYLLGSVLEFIVALGMLLVYFQKVRDDLKNEEYFLQKAQEIGNIGAWELDIRRNELIWSDESYKIFGLPVGMEVTYETFLNCVHPDDREYVDSEWKASFNKKPYDIEHRLLVDGKVKWVREKAELKFNEKDECISGIGFTQDITERKWAEAKYRDIVENAPVGIFRRDLEGKFQYVNPYLIRQLECKTEKELLDNYGLISQRWACPERNDEFIALLLENRRVYDYEIESRLVDGTTKWFALYSFLDDSDQFINGFSLDITERKRAKEALRQSETRLKTILSSINDIVFEIDLNGYFEGYHAPASKRLYVQPDYFLGKKFDEVLPEEVSALLRQAIESINSGNPYQQFEYHLTIDSTIQWEHAVVTPRYNTSNEIIGMTAVCRNITERKQAEEALQASHQLLDSTFASLRDAVFIIDAKTTVIKDCNPAATEIFGYSQVEMLGRVTAFLHIDEAGLDGFRKRLLSAMTEQGFLFLSEFKMKRKDGTVFSTEHTVLPLKDEQGQQIAWVSVVRDITERKQAQEEKEKLIKQLIQAQKMESIGTLAGGIAHDFNNILSAILGYTEIALEEIPENSKLSLYIKEVMRAGERARDLVNQILTFSRKQDQDLKPLLISLVIKEALKLLRSSIPSTIKIIKHIDPNCGLVLADPTQIHQVMMNLCTNAYHAMKETGGVLNVSLKPVEQSSMEALTDKTDLIPGSYLELTISDTGSGISKKNLERIFEPYFTTKEKGEGTGLGLAVVHGIVKSYHGEIKVNSEPGKGTVFCVFLPVIKLVQPFDHKKETEPFPGGNERILFVDDDANLATVSQIILETLGYKTTILTSSLLALDTFKSNPDDFDLLITDMTMPDMTGEQLSRKIFEIRPGMPIILCSGYSEKINSKNAEAMGIQGYLAKPVLKKDLAKMVRKVLDNTKKMVDK